MYRILFILHAFVGIGAVGGGLFTILNPEKPLGMSVEYLENSPFDNYLIPGIILFSIIGLGNLFTAFTLVKKHKYRELLSAILGGALVIWIVVQCIMIEEIAALHVIFFMIGLVEFILALVLLFRQNLFPVNIVRQYYRD